MQTEIPKNIDKDNLIMTMRYGQYFRFITPFAPYAAIIVLVIAFFFQEFDYRMNILISSIIGLIISEIQYYFTKSEVLFFSDKILIKKRNAIVHNVNLIEIEMVRYSKDYDHFKGTTEGGGALKYLIFDMKNGEEIKISFEPLFINKKMRRVLKIMDEGHVKLNDEGRKFISR